MKNLQKISLIFLALVLCLSLVDSAFALPGAASVGVCWATQTQMNTAVKNLSRGLIAKPNFTFVKVPPQFGRQKKESRSVETKVLPVTVIVPSDLSPTQNTIVIPLKFTGDLIELPRCDYIPYAKSYDWKLALVKQLSIPSVALDKIFDRDNNIVYEWRFDFPDTHGIMRSFYYIGKSEKWSAPRIFVDEFWNSTQGLFTQNIGFQAAFTQAVCDPEGSVTLTVRKSGKNLNATDEEKALIAQEKNFKKLVNIKGNEENVKETFGFLGRETTYFKDYLLRDFLESANKWEKQFNYFTTYDSLQDAYKHCRTPNVLSLPVKSDMDPVVLALSSGRNIQGVRLFNESLIQTKQTPNPILPKHLQDAVNKRIQERNDRNNQ